MTCLYRKYRNRRTPTVKVLGGALLAAALCGCGTSYKVSNVKSLDTGTKSEGVFYYLPKTIVHIEAVATEKKTKFGPYYDGKENLVLPAEYDKPDGTKGYLHTFEDVYKHNLKSCDKHTAPEQFARIEDIHIPPPKEEFSFTDFAVFTETVSDKSHLYRLEIEPSEFASFSHTVKLDERGVITSADNLIKDGGTTAVFNLAKSVAGFLQADLAAKTAGGLAAATNTARCDAFLEFVDLKYGTTEEDDVTALQDEKSTLLKRPMQDVDPDLVSLAIKDIDEQISRLKAANKKEIAKQYASVKENSFLVAWKLTPIAGDNGDMIPLDTDAEGFYELKFELSDEDKKKEKKRISYRPGTAAAVLSPLPPAKVPADIMTAANNFTFELTPEIKVAKALTINRDGLGTGYKYRIPVRSRIDILDGSGETRAKSDIMVAQLGFLAALPSKFKGSSGTLDLVFNANSGALSSAKIGAEPQSATLISDSVDLVTSYKKASDAADAAQEAEAKAAADKVATAELDAMQAEIDLLEAEIKLRELRTQLGLPVEDE